MTSGDSGTAVGLVTPAAVVTHTYLDEPGDPPDELKLEQRGDDAATLVRCSELAARVTGRRVCARGWQRAGVLIGKPCGLGKSDGA